MKKEISLKTFLTDISNWFSNKKNIDTESRDNSATIAAHTVDSDLDSRSERHQSLRQQTKYDRYHPLYFRDRDVNSHF